MGGAPRPPLWCCGALGFQEVMIFLWKLLEFYTLWKLTRRCCARRRAPLWSSGLQESLIFLQELLDFSSYRKLVRSRRAPRRAPLWGCRREESLILLRICNEFHSYSKPTCTRCTPHRPPMEAVELKNHCFSQGILMNIIAMVPLHKAVGFKNH